MKKILIGFIPISIPLGWVIFLKFYPVTTLYATLGFIGLVGLIIAAYKIGDDIMS